ncbi:MAG: DUF3127 domain-containing protein [Chitinophagales bacterium]|nr:DUF3127 domain-containing protein [Bacteroidota bacterium]MCB9043864.1 DUF3127 domain-containing protein [Chitinophagales bacterium]
MNFEIEGRIISLGEIQQKTDTFRIREFVVQNDRNVNGSIFTDYIKFQLTQDRVELLNNYQLDENVKVHFNIRGRKWEKNGEDIYFNSLDAWKVEKLIDANASFSNTPANVQNNAVPNTNPMTTPTAAPMSQNLDAIEDDLPF